MLWPSAVKERQGTVCGQMQVCYLSMVCVPALEPGNWQVLLSIFCGAPAMQLLTLLPRSGMPPHGNFLLRIGHSLFISGSPIQRKLKDPLHTTDGSAKEERMWKKTSILEILTCSIRIIWVQNPPSILQGLSVQLSRIQSIMESTCLSWPAVSQSCSTVRSPSTMRVFIWKSTPEKEYKRTWRTRCK